MLDRISFALALTLPLVSACTDAGAPDELDVDDATEGDAGKADQPGSTYTYYFIQNDLRLCVAPHCGGVFYRLANAETTRCADGKRAERCYAASQDFAQTGLDDAAIAALDASRGPLLVRATLSSKDWGSGLGRFAHLNVKEAWVAQGPNEVAGPLAKVEDTGVRCITFPCPSFREKKLNSAVTATLAELQWDQSGATDEQIGIALDKMHTDGLIVAGYRTYVTGPGGTGKARSVNQFWLKATDAAVQKTCYVGGCSGQVCSDREGVITTCEFRPEYACYRTATCEVQADGECGWTQTSELQACLANP
jgi:hypothetical protein